MPTRTQAAFSAGRWVDKARGTALRTWHGAWRAASTSQQRQCWWMRCAYPRRLRDHISSDRTRGSVRSPVALVRDAPFHHLLEAADQLVGAELHPH